MKKSNNDVIKENDVNPEKDKKTKDPKVAAEYNAKVGFR